MQKQLCGLLAVGFAIAIAVSGCDSTPNLNLKSESVISPKEPEIRVSTPSTLLNYKGGVLVSNFHSGAIDHYDAAGKYLGELAAMNSRTVESSTDKEDGGVLKMRPAKRRFAPGCMAMAGGKLFVMQGFSGYVVAIDPANGKIVQELPVGDEGAMCASADRKILYCATLDRGAISIVDAATYEYEQIKLPDDTKGPSAIAVSADGKSLYIGMQRTDTKENSELRKRGVLNGPELLVYDLAEREFVARTPLTMDDYDGKGYDVGIPNAMLLSPDGKTLFIGMFQSEAGVVMIDTKTHRVSGNIPFDSHHPTFKWADPLSLAIVSDRMLVLLRNNNELAVIDWKTRERVGVWPLKHDGSMGHHGIGVTAEKVIVDNGGMDVFNLSEIFRYQRDAH